jgi:hypothetical protein
MVNVDRDGEKCNIYVRIGEYGQRRSFQLGVNNGGKRRLEVLDKRNFLFGSGHLLPLLRVNFATTRQFISQKPLPRGPGTPAFLIFHLLSE